MHQQLPFDGDDIVLLLPGDYIFDTNSGRIPKGTYSYKNGKITNSSGTWNVHPVHLKEKE